jgi:hypothetical protein
MERGLRERTAVGVAGTTHAGVRSSPGEPSGGEEAAVSMRILRSLGEIQPRAARRRPPHRSDRRYRTERVRVKPGEATQAEAIQGDATRRSTAIGLVKEERELGRP